MEQEALRSPDLPMQPGARPRYKDVLAHRLRTLVYDGSSTLPSLLEAVDAARAELEAADAIGVLFVRIDYMGMAAELFTWEDIAGLYATLTSSARALMGVHLRKVDLPADLGLAEEGFAVLLSRPRDHEALAAADVARVAQRYTREIWRVFREALPADLANRVTVHVGGGLVRRPSADQTVVETVIAGLGEAYEDAIGKEEAHLARLAAGVKAAVELGRVDTVYQPIVNLRGGDVVGFDVGLASIAEVSLNAQDALFDVARRTGLAGSTYRAYHRQALLGAEGVLREHEWLMVRVGAADLISSAVIEMAQLFAERSTSGSAGLSPVNVVFLVDARDITGAFPSSLVGFRSAADMGFKLGVDVLMGGPLPLDHVRGLAPDILRVGGRIVQGITDDPDMFEVASLLTRFAHRHGISTLAADCRTEAQLDRLKGIGVDLVQGPLIAAHSDAPTHPVLPTP